MQDKSYIREKLNKAFSDYELFIFDLDGTLYFQKPFRVRMAVYLMTYVIMHPSAVKDILILKSYREIREKWEDIATGSDASLTTSNEDTNTGDAGKSLDTLQYEYVANLKNVSLDRVKNAVEFFMMKAPLSLLPAYADNAVIDVIRELRNRGKRVVVYSDYPVEDKLKALGAQVDGCYTSGDENIGVMKPDKRGIEVILSDTGIASSDAVMIGDRYEKDALCAIANDVDYIVLSSKKSKRRALL